MSTDTMEATNVVQFLQRHENAGWVRARAAAPAEIAAFEEKIGMRLGDEYRALLEYSAGGELQGADSYVYFFGINFLQQNNPHAVWHRNLPDMLAFATDQGDIVFYLDCRDQLRRGAWAVYCVDMGSAGAPESRFVAKDLLGLAERVVSGDDVISGPTLKQHGTPPALQASPQSRLKT